MLGVPNGYCCQDDEDCEGINSCNKNRTGPLCGMCKSNWTESLFSPTCLPMDRCPAALILVLYILCVVVYALGMMVLNYIKDYGPPMLKKGFEVLKKKLSYRKKEPRENCLELHNLNLEKSSTSMSRTIKTSNKLNVENIKKGTEKDDDDDVMKYVQILFYYVQDAALFKIQLPSEGQQEESIVVKILQFSPEVLTTFYANVSDLCFSPGTICNFKDHVLFSVWILCHAFHLSYLSWSEISVKMVQKIFQDVQSQTSSDISVGCTLFIPEDGDWSIHFGPV